eukprot:SAG11_NODE_2333_length_3504_cov_54.934508_2_plen_73_part_00
MSAAVCDSSVVYVRIKTPRNHIRAVCLRAVQHISAAVCDSSVVYVRIETPTNHIRAVRSVPQGGAAYIRGQM